jgi:hypothetical protein
MTLRSHPVRLRGSALVADFRSPGELLRHGGLFPVETG